MGDFYVYTRSYPPTHPPPLDDYAELITHVNTFL